MRSVVCVACVMLSGAVVVNAQDFTSAPAKLARDNYRNALSKVTSTYKAALESAIRQAESRKDSEEVDRIKQVLSDLADDEALNTMAPDQLARLTFKTAKVPSGTDYDIGKVAKGDKIVMKYVRGMCSYGNQPLQNPDESDKVACFLRAQTGNSKGPVTTIPKHTEGKPFEYTFESAFDKVFLTTTPAAGAWAPAAGEVTYKYAVIKAK